MFGAGVKIAKIMKRIIPSIAQLILGIGVLVTGCYFMSMLVGTGDTFGVITNLISEINVFQYWFDIVTALADAGSVQFDFYTDAINYIYTSVFEICIIAMCVDICKNLGEIFNMRGLPILQTIVGLFLGVIFVNAIELSSQHAAVIYTSAVIVIDLIIIWLMPAAGFWDKLLASVIGLGMQIIVTVFSSGYVVLLTLILDGSITDVGSVITCVISLSIPMLIFMALDYFLFTPLCGI